MKLYIADNVFEEWKQYSDNVWVRDTFWDFGRLPSIKVFNTIHIGWEICGDFAHPLLNDLDGLIFDSADKAMVCADSYLIRLNDMKAFW